MIRYLSLILFVVELGAGFGPASATVVSTSSNAIEVELRVVVEESAEAVVAHLVFEEEPELVIPLLQRQGGDFAISTELPPHNYQVVFEALGSEPFSSDPVSLTELGAVFASTPSSTTTTETPGLSDDTRRWGWLGLALAAAALSALAFWVLGGRDGEDQESSDSDSGASEEA
jgi:hypothetical protein